MTTPDLTEFRQLLDVDHTETDLEARARVLVKHLTGFDWNDMDPGLRSKVGTDMVRALHFADEIDPARQRLALVLNALPDLLARAEAADRLESGVRELADEVDEVPVDLGTALVGRIFVVTNLRALLDPAQPTSPAVDADEGKRG